MGFLWGSNRFGDPLQEYWPMVKSKLLFFAPKKSQHTENQYPACKSAYLATAERKREKADEPEPMIFSLGVGVPTGVTKPHSNL